MIMIMIMNICDIDMIDIEALSFSFVEDKKIPKAKLRKEKKN